MEAKEGHEAISYLEGHQSGEKQGIDKGRKEVVKDFETVLDAPVRYRWAMFFDVLNGWQEQLKEKGL